MAGLGKGKANVTANVTERFRAYLLLRARANGEMSVGKLAGLVFKWWLAQGAPAVIDGEPGAAKLPWDENIMWETLVERDELPKKSALPRDVPVSHRVR